jgi:hypothetical protein
MTGKSPNDIWEDLGAIDELEMGHVMMNLFSQYETMFQYEPDNPATLQFFLHLENAIKMATECNLNRR